MVQYLHFRVEYVVYPAHEKIAIIWDKHVGFGATISSDKAHERWLQQGAYSLIYPLVVKHGYNVGPPETL